MAKLTCLILLVGVVAICNAEPPRVFGRILNQNLLFQRQELPEDDNFDGPYPPAANVPELPLAPPQEYGPPQIPSTSYGVPATPSQVYGVPDEQVNPEAERIVVHSVPAKLSVRHIYKVPIHSERIIVPSHHHHSERLVVPTHHNHHLHTERLVVPAHHNQHLHAERLVVPAHHNHHLHAEKLVVPTHHDHIHSERLVGPSHAHLHSAAIPATVIRLRFSEE